MPAKDAQDARKTMSKVMAGGFSATEAIARGFGLKSHVEQRAEREAALKVCLAVSVMHLLVCQKNHESDTIFKVALLPVPGWHWTLHSER